MLELADRAGVDVGEVYRVDASRRTTGANAYVTGLGHTKRVVLYDNLIEDFTPAEVRSVVAHELGHVKHDDVPRGLLFLALITPPGDASRAAHGRAAGARERAVRTSCRRSRWRSRSCRSAVRWPAATSRAASRRARTRSRCGLTNDPDAFISLERRLALQNISEPDPPDVFQMLFGTHPTTLERIGYGEAYGR